MGKNKEGLGCKKRTSSGIYTFDCKGGLKRDNEGEVCGCEHLAETPGIGVGSRQQHPGGNRPQKTIFFWTGSNWMAVTRDNTYMAGAVHTDTQTYHLSPFSHITHQYQNTNKREEKKHKEPGPKGAALLSVGQGTLQIGSRWTGLELLPLGRVKDTFARGTGLRGAFVKGLANIIRRGVQVQRDGSLSTKRIGNGMETQLVMHIGNGISLEEGLLLDGHGLGLLSFIITVIAAQTGVGAAILCDDLVGPVVESLLQLSVKDLHEAVRAGMVMDSTGNKNEQQQQ